MSGLAGTEGEYYPVEKIVVVELLQKNGVRRIEISAPKGAHILSGRPPFGRRKFSR
jgi:hypothetical protein